MAPLSTMTLTGFATAYRLDTPSNAGRRVAAAGAGPKHAT